MSAAAFKSAYQNDRLALWLRGRGWGLWAMAHGPEPRAALGFLLDALSTGTGDVPAPAIVRGGPGKHGAWGHLEHC